MNILAADTSFLDDTTAGTAIKALLAALGIIVVLIAVFKAFKHVSTGKPGEAAKVVIGAVVLAVFLFDPAMLLTLVDLVSSILDKLLGSGKEIIDKAPSTTVVSG